MYIGKTPTVGNFQVCDAISVVNGQAAYTLQVGGTNVAPESANHMLVSLNGILQKPGSSFTISGSTMTFASNLATGDVIDFVQILGNVLDIGQPSDDTVTAAKLNNDVISGQTALASEPADTDEFLVSDAGTLKRIDYSLIKGNVITSADTWRLTTDYSGDADPISSNLEQNDDASFEVIGTPMSVSSGIFTFPETGKYFITASFQMYNTSSQAYGNIYYTVNNSSYSVGANCRSQMASTSYNAITTSMIFDVTSTTNCKIKFTTSGGGTIMGNSGYNSTHFQFIRIGST